MFRDVIINDFELPESAAACGAAKPRQTDEIGLLVFVHGADEPADFLDDGSAHEQSRRRLFGAHRRNGAALVLAANTGNGLLACGANAHLGLFCNLSRPGARRRAEYRRHSGGRADRRGSPVDILLRGQQGFSFSFLEEMWSRNIPNLLMSPLRPAEFVGALMVMSLIRLAVGVVPVTLMAISFFGFNLWALAATSKSSAHDAQAHNLRLDRVYCRVLDYGLESRAGRGCVLTEKTESLRKGWAYPVLRVNILVSIGFIRESSSR